MYELKQFGHEERIALKVALDAMRDLQWAEGVDPVVMLDYVGRSHYFPGEPLAHSIRFVQWNDRPAIYLFHIRFNEDGTGIVHAYSPRFSYPRLIAFRVVNPDSAVPQIEREDECPLILDDGELSAMLRFSDLAALSN